MITQEERTAYLEKYPGIRRALDERWRPLWRGMGVARVAADLAANGPAVRDGGDGGNDWIRANEARVWIAEELVRIAEEERIAKRRAAVSFWLSIAAVLISVGALIRGG